ncbi:MAG: DUF3794 domain-containing protein [Ruminococcus sp.]|nr:DUF3794 domain-containing protein [Ruminococcus sp.]
MEYNLSKHSVGCCNRFLDTVNEQIVDVDITLPDYCPDIEKILKCTLDSHVYTKNISGGQLTVDGVSVVRILYCDSIRHNVRSFVQSVPFTSSFSLKSTPEQYIIEVDTKCEYINCRALSPRKLVVHGEFSLYTKIFCKSNTEYYSYDEESDLQTKVREIKVSDLCAICEEQFSVTEDITISNQSPVESMLKYDVTSRITDLKNIHNKVMLNAELVLKVLYLSDLESGKVEHLSYVIPVSRVIDCDGVTDDTINTVKLEVMSSDLRVRNDSLNDGSLLSLDVKMCFSEIGYAQKSLNIIEDVYSTKYITEEKRSAQNALFDHRCADYTHIVKSSIKLDSMKISKVIDIFTENVTVSPVISKKSLSFIGKTNVCMMLEDSDGSINYLERSVDVEFKPEIDVEFDRVAMNSCVVQGVSFRLVDDYNIEVRIELRISAVLSKMMSVTPITFVSSSEETKLKNDGSSLILYYADKGESLWDISKMYRMKKSVLMNENSLKDSELSEDRMLLVVTE